MKKLEIVSRLEKMFNNIYHIFRNKMFRLDGLCIPKIWPIFLCIYLGHFIKYRGDISEEFQKTSQNDTPKTSRQNHRNL